MGSINSVPSGLLAAQTSESSWLSCDLSPLVARTPGGMGYECASNYWMCVAKALHS